MTEREAARTFGLAYLRRLAHLGGAEALAAALPTTADAMVADGLAPRRHVGAECWALTAEADGRCAHPVAVVEAEPAARKRRRRR